MARAKLRCGDRIVRTDTDEAATLIDIAEKGEYEVLLDTGEKIATMWQADVPVERVAARKSSCDRCGSPDHHAFYCPP